MFILIPYVVINPGKNSELSYKQLLVETDWQLFDANKTDISDVEISIGAEAIKTLAQINLQNESKELRLLIPIR